MIGRGGPVIAPVMPLTPMNQCPHCDESIASDADQCPNCHRWFPDQLIARTRDSDASVREVAVKNLIFVDRTDATVTALADSLQDPVQNVRRAAGVMLFISGAAAKSVVPALTAALDDSDYYIRRTAAATLSHVGSQGRSALPRLTEMKDTDDEHLRVWIAEAINRIDGVDDGSENAA